MSANPTETLNNFNNITSILHPLRRELGSLYSQITLTFAMCIGSFSYGHILVWNEAALKHMQYFKHEEISILQNWMACVSSLGTAIGIAIWGISTIRMGPKKTLMVSTILLLLCWFLIAVSQTYNFYWGSVLLASLCASSYLFAGEVFLLECVHRNNMKIFFAIFRSFIIIGVLSMGIICSLVDKTWLCIILSLQSISFAAIVSTLPDSPHFLIHKSVTKAENSLKYYMGKETVGFELNMVRQQRRFLNFGFDTNKYMLTSKVVIKAIVIIIFLQFFKICTGYYVFLIDNIRIISRSHTAFSIQTDNIILSIFWLASRFIGCFSHLYGNFGVRKPMMISMLLVSILLCITGFICFLSSQNYLIPNGCLLIFLTIYGFSYDIGMNLCPEITLYAYTPCQIYDFLRKIMIIFQWIILCGVARVYFYCQTNIETHVSLWILMCISIVGFIFITMFVIDIKGKSLMHIQMELGGNPIGTRGSIRQRLANPFETSEDTYYLRNLIAADLARTTIANNV